MTRKSRTRAAVALEDIPGDRAGGECDDGVHEVATGDAVRKMTQRVGSVEVSGDS